MLSCTYFFRYKVFFSLIEFEQIYDIYTYTCNFNLFKNLFSNKIYFNEQILISFLIINHKLLNFQSFIWQIIIFLVTRFANSMYCDPCP